MCALAVFGAVGLACSSEEPKTVEFVPSNDPPALAFPPDFLWAVTTAGHSSEGNNTNTDWTAFEEMGSCPKAGLASNGYELFETDAKNAADLHLDALQLTIEWSRVVPVAPANPDAPLGPSDVDAKVVAHYHQVIDSLVAKGIQPMVMVTHYTLPRWVHDPVAYDRDAHSYRSSLGGFTSAATGRALAQYSAFLVKEFGDKVKWWLTLDEPMLLLVGSFFSGTFPPGITNFNSWATKVYPGEQTGIDLVKNMIDAHALSYRAMKAVRNDIRVSFAHNGVAWEAASDSTEDLAARDRLERAYEFVILDALTKGEFDTSLVGAGPVETHPEWAASLDYIGVSYAEHAFTLANKGFLPPLEASPCTGGLNATLKGLLRCPKDAPEESEGLRSLLVKFHARYGLDQVITANGSADDGEGKARRLVRALVKVHEAMDTGAHVLGFFYRNLNQGYDWSFGYKGDNGLFSIAGIGDGKKFELPGGGYSAPDSTTDFTRVPVAPVHDLYRDVASKGGVAKEFLDRYKL